MQIDEVAIISTANKTTWGGAFTGIFGWLSQINWIGLGGLLIAAASAIGGLYFQKRRDKRERDLYHAQLAALRANLPHPPSQPNPGELSS